MVVAAQRSSRAGRARRYLLAALPLLAAVGFLCYLWLISGVLPLREHHANGKIKTEGYVKRFGFGVYHRQGHWVTYHPNGGKASEGFYENGKKVGPWTYWDEDGRELPAAPDKNLAVAGPE